MSNNAGPGFENRTQQYRYDELNRLTDVDYGDGGTQHYQFDDMADRLSLQHSAAGTTNYGYNAANMLLARGSDNDINGADGHTLTEGRRSNTWDSQNRLVSCSYQGQTSTYVYGSDGLRHRSTVGDVTTDFALDSQSVVREIRNINETPTNIATYLSGPSGPLYRRDDVAGTVRWYLYDGLGSVVGEVDPNGNLTAGKKFDVYGISRGVTGTPTSKHGFVGGLGHTTEDETGLIYMRARYYDAAVGRFVSEDPAREGENWFAYAGDRPTNAVDPTGCGAVEIVGWIYRLFKWYSRGKGAVALLTSDLALARFTAVVARAARSGSDGSDVEAGWASFMASWSGATETTAILYGVGQMSGSALGAGAGLVTTSINVGVKLTILCLGYSIRDEFYVQACDQ